MIAIDTGPLVAFFDASDHYHQRSLEILKKLESPILTTWAVITETFYLLSFSWRAQDNLWEFIQRGGMEIIHLDVREMKRCRQLMEKYQALPMDLADATLVAIAETRQIKRIFTLDHKNFKVYRPLHIKQFGLLPSKL